jgi:hypothetical protein
MCARSLYAQIARALSAMRSEPNLCDGWFSFVAFDLVVKTSSSLDAYLVCHVAMLFSVACVLMRVALGRS